MDIPILTWFQKGHIRGEKGAHNLLKRVLFKLYFQHEGHLYDNCFIYILTIYHKCFLFQFLGRGIRMQISTLTRIQKEHISFRKGVHNLLKNALLKFNFQHEGDLYAIFFVFFSLVLLSMPSFEFFGCDIRMHIPILTGIAKGRIIGSKMSLFCKKTNCSSFISKLKVTCMTIASVIFSLFSLNPSLFSS